RILTSEAARMEAVPPPLRRLGRVASALAGQGARFILWKYAGATPPETLEAMGRGLNELRAMLGGRRYLLDSFSYADIAAAVALQPIQPVADRFLRLGPATREAWTEPELADEF